MSEAAAGPRLAWLDSLKGLGILLVVVGHQYLPPPLHRWIFSFHVPLFFFISGMLFDPDRYANQGAYARRRARTILVPYVVFGFATWLAWAALRGAFNAPFKPRVSFVKPLVGLIYGDGHAAWMAHNAPLWFLPCLFVAANLYYWLHRRTRSFPPAWPWLLVVAAVGAVVVAYEPFPLPWGADLAFPAAVFFGAGYAGRRRFRQFFAPDDGGRGAAAAVVLFAAASVALTWWNRPVDMNLRCFGNLPLFYLAAFAGIGAAVATARLLPRLAALEWFGRNALVILVCHVPAGSLVENVIGRRFWNQPFSSWSAMLTWAAFHAAASLAICAPIALAVNRFFPWAIGKRA